MSGKILLDVGCTLLIFSGVLMVCIPSTTGEITVNLYILIGSFFVIAVAVSWLKNMAIQIIQNSSGIIYMTEDQKNGR